MGDRTPSQFLRHLRRLARNVFSDDTLRSLWFSRLPGSRQAILATQRDLTLEKLGELADAINDTNFRKHVSEASMTEAMSAMFQQLTLLTAKIAELTTSLHSGSANHNNRTRHRKRSQSRNRQRSEYVAKLAMVCAGTIQTSGKTRGSVHHRALNRRENSRAGTDGGQ